MIALELASFNYVASLTAELSGGTRQSFQNVSGGVIAVPSAASATAAAAARSVVASSLGQCLPDVRSLAIDAIDIFA